jgi:hypothetical protein
MDDQTAAARNIPKTADMPDMANMATGMITKAFFLAKDSHRIAAKSLRET